MCVTDKEGFEMSAKKSKTEAVLVKPNALQVDNFFNIDNEELITLNQELQSMNEELYSMNQELKAVNTELVKKVDELSWANSDVQKLLDNAEIALVFLDSNLHVTRFTPQISHLFYLLPSDIGRSLFDLVNKLDYLDLENNARKVLDSLMLIEKEVTASDERWFKVRIMPYRTLNSLIDGVVISCIDITESKHVEAGLEDTQNELEKSLENLEVFFNLSAYMVCIASAKGIFRKVSPAFSETLGFLENEFLTQPFVDFVHPDDKEATTDNMEPLTRGIPIIRFTNRYRCKDGSCKWLEWTARSFVNGGDIYAIAYDITDRKLADEKLERIVLKI